MIRQFNRRQSLRAIGHLVLCLIATALAYAFFFLSWFYIKDAFDLELSQQFNLFLPLLLVILVYIIGFVDMVRHGGLFSYHYSSLYFDFDLSTASGTVTDYYVSQATTSAYMIAQVLLCAPIQLLKFLGCLKSLIRDEPEKEAALSRLLGEIRENGKWHEATRYSDRLTLLRYLINMNQVEFSASKGVVKAA